MTFDDLQVSDLAWIRAIAGLRAISVLQFIRFIKNI